MKLKVCGMREPDNIAHIEGLAPDFMGFIFYEKSPRYVGPEFIMPEIKSGIKKTGVFVNENPDSILQKVEKYSLNAVQLHGDERVNYVADVRVRLPEHVLLIKAFGLNDDFDLEQLNDFETDVDFFLFDTKTNIYGGSGQRFNWEILRNYKLDKPFFISGGISLSHADELKNFTHPQFFGLDINSGFEIEPGLKNVEQIKKFKELLFRS